MNVSCICYKTSPIVSTSGRKTSPTLYRYLSIKTNSRHKCSDSYLTTWFSQFQNQKKLLPPPPSDFHSDKSNVSLNSMPQTRLFLIKFVNVSDTVHFLSLCTFVFVFFFHLRSLSFFLSLISFRHFSPQEFLRTIILSFFFLFAIIEKCF